MKTRCFGDARLLTTPKHFYLHVDMYTSMPKSTTVRISKKTKERLERVSDLTGLNNLSKTLDFAIDAAEDKLDQYHGNVNSLFEFKGGRSGLRKTSQSLDEELAQALKKEW